MSASESASGSATRHRYKLVVVGNESVGKTSIITRYLSDSFGETYKVTIGIDFVSKNVYLADRVIRLQIWDTAGQERFRALIPSYIRNCSVALLVFDIACRQTFDAIDGWAEEVKRMRGERAALVLVGNKLDLADKRQVSTEEAQAKAERLGFNCYFETSAKTGEGVKNLFHRVAEILPTFAESRPSVFVSSTEQNAAATTSTGGEGENPYARNSVTLKPAGGETGSTEKPGYCSC